MKTKVTAKKVTSNKLHGLTNGTGITGKEVIMRPSVIYLVFIRG